MKTKSIIDFVGNTPLVEAQHIFKKEGVTLLLKLEGNNPGGSVKDRAAYYMISEAIKRKNIRKGDTLVEATSGNTGIALALMAKVLGVNMVITMPENSTIERVKTMRAYGAEVILTPADKGMEGAIDYALILTCLFPVAAYKVWHGTFQIGTNDLGKVIPEFFEQRWFFVTLSVIFGVSLIAYIWKTFQEWRSNRLNVPKTVFIVITVFVAFFTAFLPNLDTAFQGLNTWHSFQYLAITFYIIKIRQLYGDLDKDAPLVAKFSAQTKDSKGLYLLSAGLLVGSVAIFILVYVLAGIVRPDMSQNQHFDTAYYTAILAFLWIHYFHDHFLFTDFETLDGAYHNAGVASGD